MMENHTGESGHVVPRLSKPDFPNVHGIFVSKCENHIWPRLFVGVSAMNFSVAYDIDIEITGPKKLSFVKIQCYGIEIL